MRNCDDFESDCFTHPLPRTVLTSSKRERLTFEARPFRLSYRLSDDWIVLGSIDEYRALCKVRLNQRVASIRFDTRTVLYGESLLSFIIENADQDPIAEAVVDIHRRWLMTPREDLSGRSPREVLLAKQDLIDFDLNSRMLQWSYFLQEPTPLSRDLHAYRYAGFGTHEWVMYYELVRFLIWVAFDLVGGHGGTNATLIAELEEVKLKWLSEPHADLDGLIPYQIIDNERRRLPEAMSARSMVIDENCPCCKMMGDESEAGLAIYFCHFDGSNMEYEFAFSSCATIEEWRKSSPNPQMARGASGQCSVTKSNIPVLRRA